MLKKVSLPILLFCFSVVVFAQERETDLGAAFSIQLQKSLGRKVEISLEEELRLLNNNANFDRLASTVGADYSIIDKKLKVGVYYCYLYMYNSDFFYENRHRYYLSLNYKEHFGKYTVSWRGRLQGTSRDECRGEYKINPKYVLRNRLQVEYSIFGSPWKPYISAETTNSLNDPLGNEIYKLRFQGGTSWRMDRRSYLEFFLRLDEYIAGNDPRVFSIGVGYKRNL